MNIVEPVIVTDNYYISTNLTDSNEAWAAEENYTRGDYVYVADTHGVYQALRDHTSASTNSPTQEALQIADPLQDDPDPRNWVYVSQTNDWKLFDTRPSQKAAQAGKIEAVIKAQSKINAVGILELEDCSSVNIQFLAGADKATLKWSTPTSVSNIVNYQYRQKKGEDSWGSWTDIPNSNIATRTYTVEGLDIDEDEYDFQVRHRTTGNVNGATSNTAELETMLTDDVCGFGHDSEIQPMQEEITSERFSIPSSGYYPGTTSITIEPNQNDRPRITEADFIPSGATRHVARIRLYSGAINNRSPGDVEVQLVGNRNQNIAQTGQDFSTEFEQYGRIIIQIGSDRISIPISGTSEPYIYTPSNSDAVRSYAERHRTDTGSETPVVTLEMNDNRPGTNSVTDLTATQERIVLCQRASDLIDKTVVIDWYSYFYANNNLNDSIVFENLPSLLENDIIKTELFGGDNLKCGQIVFGYGTEVGETKTGDTGLEGLDFSHTETNIYGDLVTLERAATNIFRFDVLLRAQNVSKVSTILKDLGTTKLALFVGDASAGTRAWVYGFSRDYRIYYTDGVFANARLTIQGVV